MKLKRQPTKPEAAPGQSPRKTYSTVPVRTVTPSRRQLLAASKPWQASRGVICPSGLVYQKLQSQRYPKPMLDHFKALRAAMTPLRRVTYEVGLAMDLAGHLGIGPRIERWLAATRLNLLAFLEKGQSNEN